MSKKISEATVETYFTEQVRERLGGIALKMEIKSRRGWPDRLVILPDGRVAFVELKTKGGQVAPQQQVRRDQLQALGQSHAFIWTREGVDRWCRVEKNRQYDSVAP